MVADKPTTVKAASAIFVLYGIFTVLVMLSEMGKVGVSPLYILYTLFGIALMVAGYGLWKMLKWGMYIGVVMGIALLVAGAYYLPEGALDIVAGLVLLVLIYVSRESF